MKRSFWIICGTPLLLGAALSACGGLRPRQAPAAVPAAKGEPMLTVTKNDDARQLALKVGETFLVSLPENPTTGYRWEQTGDTSQYLSAVKDEYVPARQGGGVVGAGGLRELTFSAKAPGSVKLLLRLRRSWENPGQAVDSFFVTVNISAPDAR